MNIVNPEGELPCGDHVIPSIPVQLTLKPLHTKEKLATMALKELPFPTKVVTDVSAAEWDTIVLVATDFSTDLPESLAFLKAALEKHSQVDSAVNSQPTVVELNDPGTPAKRLVYAPTGPIGRDQDDVRRFWDAGNQGFDRARQAGARKAVLVVSEKHLARYPDLVSVTWLGAFHSVYQPIEVREAVHGDPKVLSLGFWVANAQAGEALRRRTVAVELGNIAARDIGGSDPERMAAPRVEEFVKDLLAGTGIQIEVFQGQDNFAREFPLLAAVDRCSNQVERHRGRLIKLVYTPPRVEKTLFLVGKGITYDTGGADVKAGGIMAGMHRDKCGAAAVAGFFKTLAELKPDGLKVIGQLCMVRNSIGRESYVADEIITSRAGVRIRVGNTDAEGRMVMADPLCRAKEWALLAENPNPHIITVATLTGHVIRAYGPAYSAIMDNGPARAKRFALEMQEKGDQVGDMFEMSTIRREDYDFVVGRSEYEDVLQCNNQGSSSTARGHQFPSAFLIRASGLDQHGRDSANPLAYTHIDIAGSSGPFPGKPSGRPIAALTKFFV